MHVKSFDLLTRRLASALPRRGVIGLVTGALVMPLSGAAPALAGCKKVGKKCDKNKDCCDGARCKGGKKEKCRCKSGYDDCDGDGKCEKLDTDDANCGACGNACPEGESCQDGDCQVCIPNTPVFESPRETCSSDSECCGDGLCCTFDEIDGPITGCYDLLTNTTSCGLSCDAIVNCLNTNQMCVDGQCVDPVDK